AADPQRHVVEVVEECSVRRTLRRRGQAPLLGGPGELSSHLPRVVHVFALRGPSPSRGTRIGPAERRRSLARLALPVRARRSAAGPPRTSETYSFGRRLALPVPARRSAAGLSCTSETYSFGRRLAGFPLHARRLDSSALIMRASSTRLTFPLPVSGNASRKRTLSGT